MKMVILVLEEVATLCLITFAACLLAYWYIPKVQEVVDVVGVCWDLQRKFGIDGLECYEVLIADSLSQYET